MNDQLSFSVRGLDKLLAGINLLPMKLRVRVLRSALKAGAAVIKNEIVARAPRESGATADSVRVTPRRGSRELVKFSIDVGNLTPRKQQRYGRQSAFYARMVEYGHFYVPPGNGLKGGFRRKSSVRRVMAASGATYVPAHPFVRPAIDAAGGAALAAFTSVAADKIGRLI